MLASLRAHHPDLEIIQMSDETTPALVPNVRRKPYDGRLMSFRLAHLADIPDGDHLTLDDDVLVKGDLSHVFDQAFDVAMVKRHHPVLFEGIDMTPSCPYNTGVVFSRSQAFWQKAHEVCERFPDRFQRWWGDQMAVGLVAQRGGFRVHELHTGYNWRPESKDQTSDALVYHYKGNRKEWMC